jgi:hypothetical protein
MRKSQRIGVCIGIVLSTLMTVGCSKPKAPPVKGLGNADNDPAIVALATKVEVCEWLTGMGTLDAACPEWKAWQDAKTWRSDGGLGGATADATIVNLLEDSDIKVRALASERIWAHGNDLRKDPALVKRVLAAAAGETEAMGSQSNGLGMQLGASAARLASPLAQTGLWPQLKSTLENAASPRVVAGALEDILDVNDNARMPEVWGWVKARTTDPNHDVASHALNAFTRIQPPTPDTCKLFTERLHDDFVGGQAASAVVSYCPASIDAALAASEGRMKTDKHTAGPFYWTNAMSNVLRDAKASPAQKDLASAALRTLVLDTQSASGDRSWALTNWEPPDMTIVARLVSDKDASLAIFAKMRLAKKR